MDNSETDPRAQLALLWRAKWLILSVMVIFGAVTTVAAFILPPKYEGAVQLSPVSATSSGGSFGSAASELEGIAALAGLSTGGDSAKNEALAVLQSEALTVNYIQANNLLPVLYSKQWDAERKTWKKEQSSEIPTLWKANRDFNRRVRKIAVAKTGLITLTITWKDPSVAAQWANGLVKMANDYLRERAIQQSERNIAYLNAEASKTNIVEARTAIYSIMRTEINKAMVARGSEEYAFKVIDPATVSEMPSSPQKKLWAAGGLAVGFMLAVFFVTVRSSFRA